jgi:hypothetical protein
MSIVINAINDCSGPPDSGGTFGDSECLVTGTWTEGPATFEVSGSFATQAFLTSGPIIIQSIAVHHGSTAGRWLGNLIVNIVSPCMGTRVQILLSPSVQTDASKTTPTLMVKGDYITLGSDGGNTGADNQYYVTLTGFSVFTNE